MKVLILSVSTGQGHFATAKAVADQFIQQGVDCEIMDVVGEISSLVNLTLSRGYLLSTTYAPRAYHKIYQMMDRVTEPSSKYSITRLVNKVLSREVQDAITGHHADVIISTHVLASCMLSAMRTNKLLDNTLTINIVTDYTIHPLWQETANLDYFVVGSDLLAYRITTQEHFFGENVADWHSGSSQIFEEDGPARSQKAVGTRPEQAHPHGDERFHGIW